MENYTRAELMRQIQMLDFYAVELNLFLDTHPDDQQALQDYQYILQQSKQLRTVYENRFGPLNNFHSAVVNSNLWNWIDEPWPWENKKEGTYVDL